MSDPHDGPPKKKRPPARLSGMAALHGELADHLPPLHETPSEPPPSAPPPLVPPTDAELLRGDDFGQWAEPEAPKRSIDGMVGKIVDDRYEIRGMIGRGGMGAVFEAWQPSVQRTVALKVLLREFAENETVIKRFHKEALAASRLTHPNSISVYDFGQTDDGILFIAMEYLRGENCAEVLARDGALDPRRAIHIMRQVCKSLAEAHKAGIIHRDLKPDNVFLTEIQGERDFVKVLDFGVAKLRERDGGGTLTQAGTMFGTPKYMSPEQTRSTNLDARSDIYSLGVILYEMLMGEPPFVSDNPLSILIAHVNEHPVHFIDRRPDLDIHPAIEAIVFRALQKNRDDRQPSADALLAELDAADELLAGRPYAELRDRLPDPATYGVGAPPPVLVEPIDPGELLVGDAPITRPPPGRRSALVPLLIAIPLAAAGVYYVLGGLRTDDPAPAEPPPADRLAAAPVVPPPPPADAAAPPEAPRAVEFVVTSDPMGAEIIRAEDGTAMGITTLRFTVDRPGEYIARQAGYDDRRFTLDPQVPVADGLVELTLTRKPAPRPNRRGATARDPKPPAIARPELPERLPASPAGPGKPPPAKPEPEKSPIELELL
ncbi:MAG: serine/threonine protein kinase [Myxococcales bacterium]|nr:serine/threonine protein kinase [Myxococcales bacterium]